MKDIVFFMILSAALSGCGGESNTSVSNAPIIIPLVNF